ncbi:unnamed protein product [Polarella glacialis]|uniref:Uncharacterized protein n=1 Tax=Polarella glacialis TaxID=89957 RepID=A0A813G5Y9_POLGL|nr:unnamed protein product [Polarella glacialis]
MWMLPERPDLAYCAKEAARNLAKPRASHWARLKKLCRCLRGTSNAVLSLGNSEATDDQLEIYTDSDWAAGESRRSTSGGAILRRGWLLASWSRMQPTVALSSCEAEFLAIGTGLVEAKAVQSLAQELGADVSLRLNTDRSSAKALVMRRGFGRLKHMAVRQLWLQQEFREKKSELAKVPTANNVADILTKPVTPKVLWALAEGLGLQLYDAGAPDGGEVAQLCGLERHEPPVCQRCQRPAELECTYAGQLFSKCPGCDRTKSWHAYQRGWTGWQDEGAATSSRDEQQPVPPATRRTAKTAGTGRRTSASSTTGSLPSEVTQVNVTAGSADERAPLGAQVDAASADPRLQQSLATRRQIDYLAGLCH